MAAEQAAFIRRISAANSAARGTKVLWSTHGLQKLSAEGLKRLEVEAALGRCEVIASYKATRRGLPDCLALGFLSDGKPFHAVVGIDTHHDRILIITVYRPSRERWEDDWKTRRT